MILLVTLSLLLVGCFASTEEKETETTPVEPPACQLFERVFARDWCQAYYRCDDPAGIPLDQFVDPELECWTSQWEPDRLDCTVRATQCFGVVL